MKNIRILILTFCTIALLGFEGRAQSGMITQERKFVYMTSLGYSFGVGEIELENKTVPNKNPSIQVNQLLGYQFCDNFYMGLGVGMDFWRHTAFVPVYWNFSVNMLKRNVSPMLYLNAGYSFKWYISSQPEAMTRVIHGTKTGPMVETGLGIRIKFNKKVSLNIAASYKFQHSAIRYSVIENGEPDFSLYSTNRIKNVFYHFAGIRLGIMY